MKVQIEKNCPRCGKGYSRIVSLEEATAIENEMKDKEARCEILKQGLRTLLGPGTPDLIIAFKDIEEPDGTYNIITLDELCGGARSCTSRVGALLNEVLNIRPAKKKEIPEVPADDNQESEDVRISSDYYSKEEPV